MNTATTESIPALRRHRRTTPWAIRLLLGASIAFGIWVDVSSLDAGVPMTASNGEQRQVRLLGLSDEPSTVGAFVKSLAARRS